MRRGVPHSTQSFAKVAWQAERLDGRGRLVASLLGGLMRKRLAVVREQNKDICIWVVGVWWEEGGLMLGEEEEPWSPTWRHGACA